MQTYLCIHKVNTDLPQFEYRGKYPPKHFDYGLNRTVGHKGEICIVIGGDALLFAAGKTKLSPYLTVISLSTWMYQTDYTLQNRVKMAVGILTEQRLRQKQYNSLKKFYEIANDFGRSKEEQNEIMKKEAKRNEKLLDEYEKHWHSIR